VSDSARGAEGGFFQPIDPVELGIEQPSAEIDTSKAHPARIYDYLLGGKDNFPADREAADQVAATIPLAGQEVRANRRFLRRAVADVTRLGVDQFLDIGTGIPTANPTHEVAQAIDPDARVVYVDNDPIVLAHSRALLSTDDQTVTIQADARDPEAILGHPQTRALLDFTRPIALMFVGLWYFIPDEDDPHGLTATYRAALAPGSPLIATHVLDTPEVRKASGAYAKAAAPLVARTHADIAALFGDWPLVDPGLVPLHQWRPDDQGTPVPSDYVLGGVAIKP